MHTTRATVNFLANQNVSVLPRPFKSLDLNPIEGCHGCVPVECFGVGYGNPHHHTSSAEIVDLKDAVPCELLIPASVDTCMAICFLQLTWEIGRDSKRNNIKCPSSPTNIGTDNQKPSPWKRLTRKTSLLWRCTETSALTCKSTTDIDFEVTSSDRYGL
jgi:hypothetical protein